MACYVVEKVYSESNYYKMWPLKDGGYIEGDEPVSIEISSDNPINFFRVLAAPPAPTLLGCRLVNPIVSCRVVKSGHVNTQNLILLTCIRFWRIIK